jgi:hypothetical protein
MRQVSLTASSLGAELRINAEGAEGDLQSFVGNDFWPRFVPGAELEEVDGLTPSPDLGINIDPGAVWRFDPADRSLACPPVNILHAICVAGYMLDAKRQESGLYTLHGNVIANSSDTIALIGPISGIGKTGLSSRAADRGWQWVSDEKFVMSELGEYVGSVKGILRDAKSEQAAGDKEPNANEPYSRKISAFVIPIATDSETLVSHRYDHGKAFWHLNEEISRDVRLAPLALDGPEAPLPSFDYEDLAIRRRRAAANLSSVIPFLSIMGSEDSILDSLSEPIR